MSTDRPLTRPARPADSVEPPTDLQPSGPPGLLTLEQLDRARDEGHVETVLVVFTDLYGRFMGKRFDVDFFLDDVAEHGTHACDYLLATDMEMEPVPGYRLANWERGYGDVHLVPDLGTLRWASWLDRTALVLSDLHHSETHAPVAEAPRSILERQIEALQELDLSAHAGSELEYYTFRTPYAEAQRNGYSDLRPLGWYLEDYNILQGSREEFFHAEARRHLKRSGVPVESSKGEWGVGQQELNLQAADVLSMADRHSIYKQCLKEMAGRHELAVTFMAKLAEDQAGSSCHLHLSLWNGETNAFAGNGELGPIECSDTMRWFLGGWIAHAPDVMVFYAPTVNSYKRFQSASWAPTRLAWSHDNRTVGFRVLGRGDSLRIECRIPGADVNPYLAYAAVLASGLRGIEERIEPPPAVDGDAYAATDLPALPASLGRAIDRFEDSAFARESFGGAVVEHYAHFFRTEEEQFTRAVTDWERRRYFERI
ncbi:MAG: glutamine synthetase family protein [Acidobacteriota bacterium]|jgi:glutamine synthetase